MTAMELISGPLRLARRHAPELQSGIKTIVAPVVERIKIAREARDAARVAVGLPTRNEAIAMRNLLEARQALARDGRALSVHADGTAHVVLGPSQVTGTSQDLLKELSTILFGLPDLTKAQFKALLNAHRNAVRNGIPERIINIGGHKVTVGTKAQEAALLKLRERRIDPRAFFGS